MRGLVNLNVKSGARRCPYTGPQKSAAGGQVEADLPSAQRPPEHRPAERGSRRAPVWAFRCPAVGGGKTGHAEGLGGSCRQNSSSQGPCVASLPFIATNTSRALKMSHRRAGFL